MVKRRSTGSRNAATHRHFKSVCSQGEKESGCTKPGLHSHVPSTHSSVVGQPTGQTEGDDDGLSHVKLCSSSSMQALFGPQGLPPGLAQFKTHSPVSVDGAKPV